MRTVTIEEHGITMQVLSNLSTQQVPAEAAADLVRSANDTLGRRTASSQPIGTGLFGLPAAALMAPGCR